MRKLDKIILYIGVGFGIILQWGAIHYAQEFLGLMALMVFLTLIVFLLGKVK